MLKKFFRKDEGFTLIEVLIVVVIVAILAAISVPIYIQYVEGARAADPQATIGSIWNQCKMYRQDHGEYPTDLQALEDEEYLEIDDATREQWEFQIVGGPQQLDQIISTSTEKMKGGAGKIVMYDVRTGKFSGYGLPSDQGSE
ncbi:MAG: prepilin-type N-terminal cleavage/methylation domain-containing protein [Candidatus Zixiibacteriota bacterium]|nr:MAG: prepilin-type N-terminal cleavage/methylation domain-containing protein [candidate division Zixibacteria bacterium]